MPRQSRRRRSAQLLGVVAAVAVLAGCGGGDETASVGTTVTSGDAGVTSIPETAAPRRARLPGPPGPVGPRAITVALATWHPLMEAGVPGGNCRPLLDSVQGPLGRAAAGEDGGAPYVSLYKGIAEGCLGQLQAARRDLSRARDVGLGPDETSKDRTCNAQLLLVFGFATYLNEDISPKCPRPTTTARPTTTTSTSRPTSTTRTSTTTAR